MTVVDDYLACAGAAARLLQSDRVRRDWDAPSALEMWTVAGLAGHLGRSVLLLPAILAAAVITENPRFTAVDYFVNALSPSDLVVTSDISASIRERGVESAGSGPDDLNHRIEETLSQLRTTLPELDADHEVVASGMRMLLSEYLITRMIELTVHCDDLAISVEATSPEFSVATQDLVAGTLAAVAVRRHGFTEVLRGLARRERASGDIAAF